MKKTTYLFTLLITSSLVNAEGFHPRNCAKIGDVTVNHSIQKNDNEYILSNKDNTIHVSPTQYLVNDQSIDVGDSHLYYDLLTDFLSQSQEFSDKWADSGKNTSGKQSGYNKRDSYRDPASMQQSITMCRTILDLAAVNELALENNQAFVEAVKVTLK